MLSDEGQVKLLDFGLAKLLDAGATLASGNPLRMSAISLRAMMAETHPGLTATLDSSSTPLRSFSFAAESALTETGKIIGTPMYLAPELWLGEPATPSTDIYSLGAVLYELCSGRPPHDELDIRSLRDAAVAQDRPPLAEQVPSIPPDFGSIVDRCLRRDPAQRFATAEKLLAALETFQYETATMEIPRPPSRPADRRPLPWTVIGAALGGVIAILGILLGYLLWPADGQAHLAGGPLVMGATSDEIDAARQWCKRLLGDECDDAVQESLQREQPQRRVELSPFALDRREVTNQEFANWLNAAPAVELVRGRYVQQSGVLLADVYPMYEPFGGFTYDPVTQRFVVPQTFRHRPVTQISWHGADRYCRAHDRRLPTEAEWEFAARGAEGRRFPWGYDEPTCQGVVFARETALPCAALGIGTIDAGTAGKDVTPDGIHDLGGSVAEWVADAFAERYPECPPPCRDPMVRPKKEELDGLRVVRGGSWLWPVLLSRSTSRSRYAATATPVGFGFRCAASGHDTHVPKR